VEKTLQKAEPTVKLFIWLIIVFVLILAAYLRPSDYEIKKEIKNKILLVVKERNSHNKDFLINNLADDIVWMTIDRYVEIKDLFLFKIFIIHFNDSTKQSIYGFGAFEKLDLDNIDWHNVIEGLESKKISDLPDSRTDNLTTHKKTNYPDYDSTAKKLGEKSTSNVHIIQNTVYGIWTGKQPAYNVKNASGQDIIVNGNPVTTPACNWTLTIKEDGSIAAEQFDPENQNIVYYSGTGGDDANISNGVILLRYTVSSSDKSSTFSLTLRLNQNKEGLCIPDTNNGPNFSIIKEQ